MLDPYNPTDPEIIEWAYDTTSKEPVQDWRLMIALGIVSGGLPWLAL
jgi:hypothetical protein